MTDAARAGKDYPLRDHVVAAAWTVGAVRSARREKKKDTPEARAAFDRASAETLAYRTQQSTALRFPTTR